MYASTAFGVTATLNGQAWSRSWSRRQGLAGVAEEALEQRELARAEVDGRAVDA